MGTLQGPGVVVMMQILLPCSRVPAFGLMGMLDHQWQSGFRAEIVSRRSKA